jgi:hypothetical protein
MRKVNKKFFSTRTSRPGMTDEAAKLLAERSVRRDAGLSLSLILIILDEFLL